MKDFLGEENLARLSNLSIYSNSQACLLSKSLMPDLSRTDLHGAVHLDAYVLRIVYLVMIVLVSGCWYLQTKKVCHSLSVLASTER